MRLLERNGIAPFVGVAAVVSLLVGFGAGTFASPSILGTPASINYKPTSETREFVIFSNVAEFNDTEVGIPHDHFTPHSLIVNQGDTVLIHIYNTENEPEHHNFVMTAYGINVDLAQGENKDVTFVATQAGIFAFYCSYHQPTMRGQLIVLPTGS